MYFKLQTKRNTVLTALTTVALALSACSGGNQSTGNSPTGTQQTTAATSGTPAAGGGATGDIRVDGSSTVFPITEAVAEEFQKSNPKIRVTVGTSGTGGGFKKLCNGEIDISDASRPIKPSEVEACKAKAIEYVELPVAYDGLAVILNPQNDWATCVKVDELKTMWAPESQGKITKWSQVRPGWPDTDLKLFGPGTDSGTYDYFTDAVVGKEGSSRGDFQASEDDNTLVQGISTDKNALGYFGLAYYEANKEKLKLASVDPGNGTCVAPTPETVQNGTYQPLSRPLFIYVSKKAIERPEVKAFIDFYLNAENADKFVKEVGYIALPSKMYALVQQRFSQGVTGSIFEGKGSQVGVSLDKLLSKEGGKTEGAKPEEPKTEEPAPQPPQ